MFGNLSFGALVIILVMVLVLFGAKRIPEITANFVEGIREFRRNVLETERSVVDPEPTVKRHAEGGRLAGDPPFQGETSRDRQGQPGKLV